MRILHVDHSTVLGGAERSVLELARAQSRLGHDVAVAVGRRGRFSAELTSAGIEWHDLNWSERYIQATRVGTWRSLIGALPDLAYAARNLRREIGAWRPDVVQAHTRKAQLVASVAKPRATALVWHLRDDLPSRAPLRVLIRWALRRADHAVALSRWLARTYTEAGAVPKSGHIGVVPSGVSSAALSDLPTHWLAGERTAIIGYVGQIARWKAPHLLIDAAEQMLDTVASFRLIGDVSFPAAEERYGRWLRTRLETSPARHLVEWLPATARPESAFAEIDILAHTSVSPEPFGRVIVEAMASSRPIVALSRGSARELLDDSTAVFVHEADGRSFAAAIRSLIADPARARLLAEHARERAITYSPAAVARLMDTEYECLGK